MYGLLIDRFIRSEDLVALMDLASWENIHKRAWDIKQSLELIYDVTLDIVLEEIPLDHLYPSQNFLENDKLALVFMKVITEEYNVPIIAVKNDEDYFILDGHHRSFISIKLKKKLIRAYVLKFPENKNYRFQLKRPLKGLPIKNVNIINDPILMSWSQILTVMKYYEALYRCYFTLRQETVSLGNLVPTQSIVKKAQIDLITEILVPILCIIYKDKYYILDGHSRSLRA
ncbi:MAG: hypothetical protein QG670_1854 [Thermoproteota archaeon]|nr:hypothetical protein [Thermoproteota archaeon]